MRREQSAHVATGQIRLQRPGRVGVPEGEGEVGDALEHDPLVRQPRRDVDRVAVDTELRTAGELQLEPRRRDDDVGIELAARREADAPLGEGVDVVGDDVGLARPDGAEQVTVGRDAHPLVPGPVARREVGVDVVAGRQPLRRALAQHPLHHVGPAPAELVEALGHRDERPLERRPGPALGDDGANDAGERCLGRHGQDVRGRALHHRDVGRDRGEGRHDRHCRRPAADHHHLPTGAVEVVGPGLRMHDATVEPIGAGEVRLIAVVVAVVPGAPEQERARERHGVAGVRALGRDVPPGLGGRPVGGDHAVPEADLGVDALGGGGVLDVAQDRRPVGDRPLVGPRPERIAERVQIGVRAHTGEAEEVPRAAERRAALEDRVARPRALGLQVVPGGDAGQPGAHDQHVEVLHGPSASRAGSSGHSPSRYRERQ